MKLENIFKKELEEKEPDRIDSEIVMVLNRLEDIEPYDDKYQKVAENLERLYKIKRLSNEVEKSSKDRFEVSPDVIFSSIVSLIGIGAVLHYEQLNVITSKVFGFAMNMFPKKRV